jgi:hypothetical protein
MTFSSPRRGGTRARIPHLVSVTLTIHGRCGEGARPDIVCRREVSRYAAIKSQKLNAQKKGKETWMETKVLEKLAARLHPVTTIIIQLELCLIIVFDCNININTVIIVFDIIQTIWRKCMVNDNHHGVITML